MLPRDVLTYLGDGDAGKLQPLTTSGTSVAGTNSPFAALERFRQLLEVLLQCR